MTNKQVHDLLDKFDEVFRSEFGGYVGYTNDGEYKFEYNSPGFVIKSRSNKKAVFKEKRTKFENIHEFRARVEFRMGQEFPAPAFVDNTGESGFIHTKTVNVNMGSSAGKVTYRRAHSTGITASGLSMLGTSAPPPTKLPHLATEEIVKAFQIIMNRIGNEIGDKNLRGPHDLPHGYTMEILTHVNPSGILDRQGYMRIAEPANPYVPAKSGQYVQTGLWDQRICDNFKGEGTRAIRKGLEHVVGEPEDMGEFSGLGDIASALQEDE